MRTDETAIDNQVRWGTSDAVLVLLATQVVGFVWFGLLIVAFYGGTVPDPLPISLLVGANIGLWIGYGGGPVLVSRLKGRGPVVDFGVRLVLLDIPLGLVAGILVQIALLPVLYFPISKLVDTDPSESARELIESIDSPLEGALFALSAAVMAPLVEELFFRGLLLRSLERWLGSVPAVIISSLVFAAIHRELIVLPGLFVFGAIAATIVVRTGRLAPAVALHVGFNATTLVLLGWL
ncbi:MAG: CPBP family intramembrane metalloprotease [Actinomycetia bacterium]|nr:CPBP family intramembrane metalloprotease [Actinomycetes bacterium]